MNRDDKTTPVEQDQAATPMPQARNAGQGHQEARRRLLKAATVAPIIYTLPSGAALAASSTTCLGDSENIITGVTEEVNCDDDGLNCETVLKAPDPDNRVFTPTGNTVDNKDEFHNSGKDYIYYQTDQTLIAGSCWNSINLSSTKFFDGFI
ncbi:hypothetical protein [Halochromatium salexigens]|uniref:hypothetical protein n=1 Tax=Halochromatium salexigens TaxID=49447 RepID=UPI00191236CC|nr:hypothetical protein [Halochromatium salexigens]